MSGAKVRENRLRRVAERRGLAFSKSRRRDPRATDYGTYCLGSQQYPDLDSVEEALNR